MYAANQYSCNCFAFMLQVAKLFAAQQVFIQCLLNDFNL